MTDVLVELKTWVDQFPDRYPKEAARGIMADAAVEIERLRTEVADLRRQLADLREEHTGHVTPPEAWLVDDEPEETDG